jgi:hypothetical protein
MGVQLMAKALGESDLGSSEYRMVTRWSSSVLNVFIAPGIDTFSQADVPDITREFPQAPYWLANHFLGSVLRAQYREGFRQVALGFIRRAYHGFRAYHEARRLTFRYLAGNQQDNPKVVEYYDAVAEWEQFVLQVSMSLDLFRWLNGGAGAFVKNDGSPPQRLYTLANQVKHLSSCVDSGQCKDTDAVPLWMTSFGLHSFGVVTSYEEAAQVLREVAQLADDLQDPLTFAERAHNRSGAE